MIFLSQADHLSQGNTGTGLATGNTKDLDSPLGGEETSPARVPGLATQSSFSILNDFVINRAARMKYIDY